MATPSRRPRPAPVLLPEVQTHEDLLVALNALGQAIGEGRVDLPRAKVLVHVYTVMGRVLAALKTPGAAGLPSLDELGLDLSYTPRPGLTPADLGDLEEDLRRQRQVAQTMGIVPLDPHLEVRQAAERVVARRNGPDSQDRSA